jgi:O-antigen/teichoic acid export membrane protein
VRSRAFSAGRTFRSGHRVNVPQRVAVNTTVQLVGRTISIALTLISFAIVTRYLGVAGFGAYSLVLTFLMLTVAIADLGTTPVGVRELARRPDETHSLVGNLLGLRVLFAGLAALALLALSPLVQYESRVQDGLRLASLAAIALVLVGVPAIVFQSRLRMELAMLVEVVSSATTLVLLIIVTTADLGFSAVVLATVGGSLLAAATGYVLAARLTRLRPQFERSELQRITKASLPVGLFMILGIVHFKIDTVLLSILKPLADVGTYSVAYRFIEQLLFIPSFFVAAVFPIIASYHATGDALLKLAIDKSFAFLVIVGFPVAAGLFVVAPDVIDLLAGEEFDEAVTPLRILLLSSIFFFTNALFSSLLVIYDLERQMAVLVAAVVVGNIALNLVLIPPYSYTGAAVSTVITEVCGGIAMMIWASRAVGARVDVSPVPRVLAATAGMVAAMWAALAFPFGLTLVVGVLVYGLLGYLLGVVSRSDLALLVPRTAR